MLQVNADWSIDICKHWNGKLGTSLLQHHNKHTVIIKEQKNDKH